VPKVLKRGKKSRLIYFLVVVKLENQQIRGNLMKFLNTVI